MDLKGRLYYHAAQIYVHGIASITNKLILSGRFGSGIGRLGELDSAPPLCLDSAH